MMKREAEAAARYKKTIMLSLSLSTLTVRLFVLDLVDEKNSSHR